MKQDYIYSDSDSKLKKESTGNIDINYDGDVIDQSVRTIFATITGERVRNPIGSTLVRYLFEPMTQDTVDDIKNEIRRALGKWEPRISLRTVIVRPEYDQNYYKVWIVYDIVGLTGQYQTQLNLRQIGN